MQKKKGKKQMHTTDEKRHIKGGVEAHMKTGNLMTIISCSENFYHPVMHLAMAKMASVMHVS